MYIYCGIDENIISAVGLFLLCSCNDYFWVSCVLIGRGSHLWLCGPLLSATALHCTALTDISDWITTLSLSNTQDTIELQEPSQTGSFTGWCGLLQTIEKSERCQYSIYIYFFSLHFVSSSLFFYFRFGAAMEAAD